jgi:hypothetical protein
VGIEPTYRGFADPCLTSWLSRLIFRRLGRPASAELHSASPGERPSLPKIEGWIWIVNGIAVHDSEQAGGCPPEMQNAILLKPDIPLLA